MYVPFGRVENTVGKGENAGYHHFLLFLQCLRNPFSQRSIKIGKLLLCQAPIFVAPFAVRIGQMQMSRLLSCGKNLYYMYCFYLLKDKFVFQNIPFLAK